MSPAVSVIVPCHNAAATVGHQISAVLTQLRPDDELVLVDNRSTDATRAVLDAAAARDGRVRVVSAEERAGANHARNVGMQAARNRILLFCDADDRVNPGWVQAFRDGLREGGIAGGRATPVDASNHRVGDDIGLHEIFGGPAYPLGASMGLTREVVEAVGGFDESFAGGHDETDLAWRAAVAGWETRFVPAAHILYVQRPEPRAVMRQRRNYARTAILLWTRHPGTVHPNAVSFRATLRRVTRNLPAWVQTRKGTASPEAAAEVGWGIGLLDGHVRYRILGRPPAPIVPQIHKRA